MTKLRQVKNLEKFLAILGDERLHWNSLFERAYTQMTKTDFFNALHDAMELKLVSRNSDSTLHRTKIKVKGVRG